MTKQATPLSRGADGRTLVAMDLRGAARSRLGGVFSDGMRRLNDRHPWNHNDAFHPWITTRLPGRRGSALDVGCGRGELLARLAELFDDVHGTDADAQMRRASRARCAGLPNVRVDDAPPEAIPTGVDLVTMVAVLHHLDLESTLRHVRRILNPGGRFLCVGLARPATVVDHAWDIASMVTNPIIGFVRHPWPATTPPERDPFPVKDPELTFTELGETVRTNLPGARLRHHLGFRHTIEWTRPS